MSAEILPFPAQTYEARLFFFSASGFDIVLSGTLCGGIDLSISSEHSRNCTYNITPEEARFLAAYLLSVAEDVERNCLFERDLFLKENLD